MHKVTIIAIHSAYSTKVRSSIACLLTPEKLRWIHEITGKPIDKVWNAGPAATVKNDPDRAELEERKLYKLLNGATYTAYEGTWLGKMRHG